MSSLTIPSRHGRVSKLTPYYKNSLCDSFQNTGECRWGDLCTYAHGEAELKKYRKLTPCKYFAEGHCYQGIRCDCSHGDAHDGMQTEEVVEHKQHDSGMFSLEFKDSGLSGNLVSKGEVSLSSVSSSVICRSPPIYIPDDKLHTPESDAKLPIEANDICIYESEQRLNIPVCATFDEEFFSRYYYYTYRANLPPSTQSMEDLLLSRLQGGGQATGAKLRETVKAIMNQAKKFYEELKDDPATQGTFNTYGRYSRFDAKQVIWTTENVEKYARVAAAYRITTLTGQGVHHEDPVILPLPPPPPSSSYVFDLTWKIAFEYRCHKSHALDVMAFMYAKVANSFKR